VSEQPGELPGLSSPLPNELPVPAGIVPAVLETARLVIRPFNNEDLTQAHRILNEAFGSPSMSLAERRRWLEWSILS